MSRTPLLVLLLLACTAAGPVPLRWGEEACRHCHMTLADRRFGAELVGVTGRTYAFDDAGCAAEFVATGGIAESEIGSAWVVDLLAPDSLLDAATAAFVRSDSFPTPMGSGIVATRTPGAADSIATASAGTRLTWSDVLASARRGELRH